MRVFFRSAITLSIFFVLLGAPAVLAQELPPESNPVCWKKAQCIRARAQLGGKTVLSLTEEEQRQIGEGFVPNEEECVGGSASDPWGKCLPTNVATTEISFGGRNRFLHIGDFIQSNYRYALGIVGIVAAVMIIVAGFQWVTSGGNSEAITSAKKRIGGSLIGLFIAYMSYFILNTINPATVNLRMPQVWLSKTNVEKQPETSDWCDPTAGSVTRTNCEKSGKICVPINWVDPSLSTPCLTAFKIFTWGIVGVAGAGSGATAILGEGLNATVGQLIRSGGARIVNYVMPIRNATGVVNTTVQVVKVGGGKLFYPAAALLGDQALTGGAGREIAGETIVDAAKSTGGLTLDALRTVWSGSPNGMCIEEADHSLGQGEICGRDANCANGAKCVPGAFSDAAKCWAGTTFGFCSNGGQHATCRSDGNDCKDGFKCVKNARWDIYSCTDGKNGADCGEDADCASGLACSQGYCTPANLARGGDGDPCSKSSDCRSEECMVVTVCGTSVMELDPGEDGASQAVGRKYFSPLYTVSSVWNGNNPGAIGFCGYHKDFLGAGVLEANGGQENEDYVESYRKKYRANSMRYCQVYSPRPGVTPSSNDYICKNGCGDVNGELRTDFAPHYGS